MAVLPWHARAVAPGRQPLPPAARRGLGVLGLAALAGGGLETGYMGAVPLLAEAGAAGALGAMAAASAALLLALLRIAIPASPRGWQRRLRNRV